MLQSSDLPLFRQVALIIMQYYQRIKDPINTNKLQTFERHYFISQLKA